MVKKTTLRIKQAEEAALQTLPEQLLFSSLWNKKDYHERHGNFYHIIFKEIFFMYKVLFTVHLFTRVMYAS